MGTRFNVLLIMIIIVFIILIIKLFYVQIIKTDEYKIKLETLTNNTVEGGTAPRGRIYDRNGKIIVDNKPNKVISYKKVGLNTKEEIEIAYILANTLEINTSITDNNLRKFWIKLHADEAINKITE